VEHVLKYFGNGLTEAQVTQLGALDGLYRDWNAKINVISRKDMDNLYVHHVLHSLAIARVTRLEAGMRVLDLGTGGGFPGIPLAIVFPEAEFVLVDSIGKKVRVAQAVADALGLKNVSTVHCRAEELKGKQFDFVVSRGVMGLGGLWKMAKGLIRPSESKKKIMVALGSQADSASAAASGLAQSTLPNGLIALKGGDLSQELQEVAPQRTMCWDIADFFSEEFFAEKKVVYVQN